ncbi:hypothetical protein BDV98DRAFT_597298 [Pterulicium gracile]|uniref:Extracellular metalloproteinase n=1 Tax=Pterulicium gracile TaxID=1884261 RepID=A0A5C3QEG9_9AGAR|nr:hypothetical protein BDV98DRAFT_597298 [Pterula gracilis]
MASTPTNHDDDLESDIVIHEYTHGLMNRLTGGGTGRCLTTAVSGGLGEGWSDAMADWANIRRFLYSTNTAVNRLKYSSLRTSSGVHRYGEIWANMLHTLHAQMMVYNEFDANARTNPESRAGYAMSLHILIDAPKLQLAILPVRLVSLVDAKNALIQADYNRYNGLNRCSITQVFARRGLG